MVGKVQSNKAQSQAYSDSDDNNSQSEMSDDNNGNNLNGENGSNKNQMIDKLIEQETPQLQKMLNEMQSTIDSLSQKLKPMIAKIESKSVDTKHGMTYLEMKYNLLSQYCSFLSFYVLLKLEGHEVENHPVIERLLHIKTLLERLRPLDNKLQYQVDKLLRMAEIAGIQQQGGEIKVMDNLQYKPNIESLKQMDNDDEEGEERDEDDDEDEDQKKNVFKAAKLNPVLYEDKETKKQRREEILNKKKMSKSSYVNELRREVFDMPEEVHLGGMTSQKTKFAREMDTLEKLEQENFKRISFTKQEIKDMRRREKEALNERIDQVDDLRGLEDLVDYGKKHKQQSRDDHQSEKFHQSLNKYIKTNQPQKKKNFKKGEMTKRQQREQETKRSFQNFIGGGEKKRNQKFNGKKQGKFNKKNRH